MHSVQSRGVGIARVRRSGRPPSNRIFVTNGTTSASEQRVVFCSPYRDSARRVTSLTQSSRHSSILARRIAAFVAEVVTSTANIRPPESAEESRMTGMLRVCTASTAPVMQPAAREWD